jgi:hypothetical protein
MSLSERLLETTGEWVAPGVMEWGNWSAEREVLLDEIDIQYLRDAHHPYQYKEDRAVTVKKYITKGLPLSQLVREMNGRKGYSERSIQKDATALRGALDNKKFNNTASFTCVSDNQ